MADDWELEAVQEQFKVFDTFTVPFQPINASNLAFLLSEVKNVISQHLRWNIKCSPLRQIGAKILTNTPEEEENIKFSYIVVVLNQEVNNSLGKIPVLTILAGRKRIFIDLNCSVYSTWDAFMKCNTLPACKFCFPVGGQYSVGGKLKIDFASSPAASLSVSKWWLVCGGIVVSCVAVVSTFFFKIPPTVLRYAQQLIPLAKRFISGFSAELLSCVSDLAFDVQRFRDGNSSVLDLILQAARRLQLFQAKYSEEISAVWKSVMTSCKQLYHYIYSNFTHFFESAPESSRHEFLAITSKVDSELSSVKVKADIKLNQLQRDIEQTENSMNAAGEHTEMDAHISALHSLDGNQFYNKHIFENCQTECALQNGIKSKYDSSNPDLEKPLGQDTDDLLKISYNIAERLQKSTLNEVQDIFEGLSCIIKEEYERKIDTYTKMVNAARSGAGHDIDIRAFNNSLGIIGDPKDHYMKEAMLCLESSLSLITQMKEKLKELQNQKKIQIIPIYTKTEDKNTDVYRIIGVCGTGMICAQDLLTVLKEMSLYPNDHDLVMNETSSLILIRSEKCTVIAYQNIDEENTFSGLMYINNHSD